MMIASLGMAVAMPGKLCAAKQPDTSSTYYMYNNGSNLYNSQSTLVVKENLKGFAPEVLQRMPNHNKVTKIILSSNVSSLPNYFFQHFPNLKEIRITKSFKGQYTFSDLSYCEKLRNITVEKGNKKLKVKDGVLYTYNMKGLIAYPNLL